MVAFLSKDCSGIIRGELTVETTTKIVHAWGLSGDTKYHRLEC